MCLIGLPCRCRWLVDHGVSFSQKGLNDVKNNALRPRTGIRPEDVSRSRSSPLLPSINSEQAWHVLHLHQHLELCWMWLWDFFHNDGFNITLPNVHSKDSRLKLFFVFAICLYCTVQCVSRFHVGESLRRVTIPRLVMDRTSNLPEAVTWAFDLIWYNAS